MFPITDPHSIIKKCVELFKNKNGPDDFIYLIVETDEYIYNFLNNGDINFSEIFGTETVIKSNELSSSNNLNEFIENIENIEKIELIKNLIYDELSLEVYRENGDIFFGCNEKHIKRKHELLVLIENQYIISRTLHNIKNIQDELTKKTEELNILKVIKIPDVSQKELNDLIVANVTRNVTRNVSFGEMLDKTAKDILDEPYYQHCYNESSLNTELYFLFKKRKQENEIKKKSLILYPGSLEKNIINLQEELEKINQELVIIKLQIANKKRFNKQTEESFKKLGGVFKTFNRANRDLFPKENVSFGKSRVSSDISYLKGLKC